MSLRTSVLKGAASLGVGQALSQGLSLVRNVIVARLISPEDFGIAATFAITVSLFEMLSDLAVDKLIIQARDGDDPRLQATAHSLQAVRGLLCGLLTAALAWPIAGLFKTPDAVWAYALLGLVPVLRGMAHLDAGRLQREMRFLPAIITQVGSQAVATAAAWPLARWLGDYSVMLWVVLLQSLALVLLSHAVAARRYAWSWDRVQLRRLMVFGWPLLINGVLMFGVFQGDRILIGGLFSKTDLAVYSVVISAAFVVPTLLGSVSLSLLLPLFASVQADRVRLLNRYTLAAQGFALLAGAYAILMITFGPWAIGLVFGSPYGNNAALIGWVAIMQSARLVRLPPTMLALACGDTRNSMIANFVRIVAVPAALLVVATGAAFEWVAAIGALGELAGFAAAVFRAWRKQSLKPAASVVPVAAAALIVIAFGYPSIAGHLPPLLAVAVGGTGFAAIFICALFFQASRAEVFRAWHAVTRRAFAAAHL